MDNLLQDLKDLIAKHEVAPVVEETPVAVEEVTVEDPAPEVPASPEVEVTPEAPVAEVSEPEAPAE